MGKSGGNKGFDSFVQSIMSKETKPHKREEQITKVLSVIEPKLQPLAPQNDADLLKLLNNNGDQNEKVNDDTRARLKTIGLGYEKGASAAKLESLNTLQGLKQKYGNKVPSDSKDKSVVSASRPQSDESKFAFSKKITKTTQDKLIEDKKQKLNERLQKAKAASGTIPAAETEKPEQKKHFKKRDLKKTRSKLKNRRKDNRPPEVLQKKFGSILNVA